MTNTPTTPDKPQKPTKPTAPSVQDTAKTAGAPASQDDLLASINRNFGSGEQPATKAKRDSLAEMNKKLPDWNLEPPETFLP